MEYVLSDQYTEKMEKASTDTEKVCLERSRKVVLKMYDHVNLAKRQYNELKESDDDFEIKFKKSFQNHQIELTREMSNQLVTLVGIFTAIAFVVFGGISSLDNIFQSGMSDIPLLRLMILGIIWALCMTNLVYIFLFCVGKITKLSFKSSENPKDNLVKKYPIIFWSNYLFLGLLLILSWIYYLYKNNYLRWLNNMANQNSLLITVIGFLIIVVVLAGSAGWLIHKRKEI